MKVLNVRFSKSVHDELKQKSIELDLPVSKIARAALHIGMDELFALRAEENSKMLINRWEK